MGFFPTKKKDRLAASWRGKIASHVPPGMAVDGVVSGGKGISHRAFFGMLGGVVGLSIVLGMLLKLAGFPAVVVMLGMVAAPNVILIFIAEVGIYRSIYIFWDKRQVVIIEGGAYDRLIRRRIYPLPLAGGISWADPGTVIIEGWEIHLDYPGLCRDMLIQALGTQENDRQDASGLDQVWSRPEGNDAGLTRQARSKASAVAYLFLGIGFLGWIGAFFCSIEAVGKWPMLAEIPLPVGPAEVVADHEGNLYLISKFYRRIQKYGRAGGFVHGWHLSTFKGDHRYAVDAENRLHVFVGRDGDSHFYLDEIRGIVRSIPGESGPVWGTALDQPRPRYEYHSWYLLPRVVRIDLAGRRKVVMHTSFWLWLFTAPVPALVFVVFGMLGAKYIEERHVPK